LHEPSHITGELSRSFANSGQRRTLGPTWFTASVAFHVVEWPVNARFAALCPFSLGIIIGFYDLVVRRTRPTQFLFGMK
jgi:hypothetical protein